MTMSNNIFMQKAIDMARLSGVDIPVGCVIMCNDTIITKAHNLLQVTKAMSAHAEILALRDVAKKLNNKILADCSLYVTLEPCPMCAWAILNSRLKEVYFGSYDLKYGAFGSKINLCQLSDYKPKVFGGIMESECNKILKDFFLELRK